MTGPEHYREAEQLVRMATTDRDQLYTETNLEPGEALAAAQVHATLAHTAATALETHTAAWRDVTGGEIPMLTKGNQP